MHTYIYIYIIVLTRAGNSLYYMTKTNGFYS